LAGVDNSVDYEGVGFREEKCEIFGLDLSLVRIPVSSVGNVSAIIKLARHKQFLKT
jgi:serine kinase of HPr protein (carbohydrate metabolism regulator)